MQIVVAIFESARNVIKAEKLCREHDIEAKVMPVPEHLSSECGMCLHVSVERRELLYNVLKNSNINVTIYNNDR